MQDNITVEIKLKPYLKEYIECKLANRYDERNNLILTIIKPFLERIPSDYKPKKSTCQDEILEIKIPIHMKCETRDGKFYISEENQDNIERIVYAHFKDALFSYIDDKIRYNSEIKKCLLQFCSDNNITFNNTNYDTLKKAYYRARKKINIFRVSVPNLSLIFLL
jgi:hypothetical protein